MLTNQPKRRSLVEQFAAACSSIANLMRSRCEAGVQRVSEEELTRGRDARTRICAAQTLATELFPEGSGAIHQLSRVALFDKFPAVRVSALRSLKERFLKFGQESEAIGKMMLDAVIEESLPEILGSEKPSAEARVAMAQALVELLRGTPALQDEASLRARRFCAGIQADQFLHESNQRIEPRVLPVIVMLSGLKDVDSANLLAVMLRNCEQPSVAFAIVQAIRSRPADDGLHKALVDFLRATEEEPVGASVGERTLIDLTRGLALATLQQKYGG
jgi:hypothetical protein